MKTSKEDFSQNMNSMGPPTGFLKESRKLINNVLNYSDTYAESVSKDIASTFKLNPNGVTFCNGSTDAIFMIPKFLDKKIALIPHPTFWEYSLASERADYKIISIPLIESNNFTFDLTAIERSITSDTVIYLCNPNNPTSTLIKRKKLINLIKNNPNSYFIIDETYLMFRKDYLQLTLTKEAQKLNNLFVITSFSKIFAVPGIRSAFLVSSPLNITNYRKFHIPYSTNILSEKITSWLVKQTTYLMATREFFQNARHDTYKLFNDKFSGLLKPFAPEANFILLKILVAKKSTYIVSKLNRSGFLVRDGVDLGMKGDCWLRVCIKSKSKMVSLSSALYDILVE